MADMSLSCLLPHKATNLLTLPIRDAKIKDFYNKLGLTDKKMKRDVQAATLMASNNLIENDILLNLYKKYNLIECKELAELTTNNQ